MPQIVPIRDQPLILAHPVRTTPLPVEVRGFGTTHAPDYPLMEALTMIHPDVPAYWDILLKQEPDIPEYLARASYGWLYQFMAEASMFFALTRDGSRRGTIRYTNDNWLACIHVYIDWRDPSDGFKITQNGLMSTWRLTQQIIDDYEEMGDFAGG